MTTGSIVGAFSFSVAAGALLSSRVAQFLHPKQTLLITTIVLSITTPIFFMEFKRTLFAVIIFLMRMAQGFVIGICGLIIHIRYSKFNDISNYFNFCNICIDSRNSLSINYQFFNIQIEHLIVFKKKNITFSEPQLLTVMTCLYPEKLGFVTGAFELAASTSSMIGPLIGGFTYQTFGFTVSSIIPSK